MTAPLFITAVFCLYKSIPFEIHQLNFWQWHLFFSNLQFNYKLSPARFGYNLMPLSIGSALVTILLVLTVVLVFVNVLKFTVFEYAVYMFFTTFSPDMPLALVCNEAMVTGTGSA